MLIQAYNIFYDIILFYLKLDISFIGIMGQTIEHNNNI